MRMGEIPLWGEWGILGLSLGLNAFFLIRYALGQWVPRAQLEQVQKMADTFREAWQTDQASKLQVIELATSLTTIGKTMEKVLNALPQADVPTVIDSRTKEGE